MTTGFHQKTDSPFKQVNVVGTPVSLVSLKQLLSRFDEWVASRQDRYIVFRDVHGVIAARSNPQLNQAHKRADVVAPDGMPLVWTLRAAGATETARLCGPDFLPVACEYGLSRGWRHYFYGGKPSVTEKLISELGKSYPGIKIVGSQCPPFRKLTSEEDELACAKIRDAKPDFVWVGLGTPKQEIWMFEHQGLCGGAIMLGIGAAFDIHAKALRRAPSWMQQVGLEGVYRLLSEPLRLWRRYLIMAPSFVVLASLDILRRPRKSAVVVHSAAATASTVDG